MVAKVLKVILLLFLMTGAIQTKAQNGHASELQQWKDSVETARAMARQEQQLMDSLHHAKAAYALQSLEFVLESDELTLKHGERGYVNSTTNFIALHKGKATIQISPFYSASGPNGVGGITVEGTPSGLKIKTDKKGFIHLTMNVLGSGLSAQITLSLNPSDHRATATVLPNFNSFKVTLDGKLVPFAESTVFKGSSL